MRDEVDHHRGAYDYMCSGLSYAIPKIRQDLAKAFRACYEIRHCRIIRKLTIRYELRNEV